MRLDKFLALATGHSRKLVHRFLRQGDVRVNGLEITDAGRQLAETDKVSFQGAIVSLAGHGYWMLHKPAGYVCANSDAQHPTVLDLLADHIDTGNLQIAGRLDLDTTGLVLITTDGDWNHRLTSPRYHCAKRYRLQLAEPLTATAQLALEQGVKLRGEAKPTRAATIETQADGSILMSISEGKYHQVKRMLAAVDNRVIGLHREAIGAIELDKTLVPGQFRPLTTAEINSVFPIALTPADPYRAPTHD